MSERTRIDRLVEDALACADGERDAFLDAACQGNAALRGEIASLLAQASRAHSFLEEPAALPSLIGRTIGPYRIDAPIGAGGMGQVYRARDTKLGRDVAIKILPAFMAQDPDLLARLGREARALAALNHPHIGSIYGLEDADGVRGLVLELVDGETLADRIARGPLPILEAVRIAAQIAEALAAAHAKGIVHRDLKPANIKITSAGSVKVLDFGLAKMETGASESTTLATREGSFMGTPPYMSPEQARGEAVDQQTDIWAFGCVLYEMLTARRAFDGRTASDAVAAVLTSAPDWTPMPAAAPVALQTLLARCLAKDRVRRLHSIADAKLDLESAFDRTMPAPQSTQGQSWQKWFLAAALGVAIGLAGYLYGQSRVVATPSPPYSVELDLPEGTKPWAGVAISPDGKSVAASVALNTGSDARHLIIRNVDQPNGWQRINNGDAGEYPFWSPDGKHLAFFSGDKLLRVDLPNGAPVTVCEVMKGRGGVWLDDGTIVFGAVEGPLMRIDAQGGRPPIELVPVEKGRSSPRYPATAGPGRLLYFSPHVDDSRSELRAINLDAPQRQTIVMKTSKSGIYERGYLFYDRNGTIIRQRFDPVTNQLQGEPTRVTNDASLPSGHLGYLPLATAGDHVAIATILQPLNQLVWMARDGRPLGVIGDAIDQQEPDLSPDGKQLAIARRLPGQWERNVWIVDTQSGVNRRLTTGSNEYWPVWAPDGERVAFTSTAGWDTRLLAANIEGSPTLTALADRSARISPVGWDRNGRFVWTVSESTTDTDLRTLGIFVSTASAGSREAEVLPFRVGLGVAGGRLSPDGAHIAYVSAKSGRTEVYVDTFPTPAGRPQQISTNGGRFVHWAGNGRELYFVAGDDLMAVPVSPRATARFGVPERLFKLSAPRQFAGSADGAKFLVVEQRTSPSSSLKLTLNMFSSLAARD